MADNTRLNPGSGGDLTRTIDKNGAKTPTVVLDLGGSGAESLLTGTLPVSGTLDVTTVSTVTSITNPVAVTGSFFQATQPVSIAGTVAVNGSGATQPVSAVALPLPSNAAAETGGNLASLVAKDYATQTTLSALNTKVTACNTGAVVISSGVITGITNPVAVTGTFFQATQPVSGSVTAQATATEDAPTYTEAAASNLNQDLKGNLRTRVSALVSESAQAYLDGEVRPLSLNSEGRLRVSVVPAPDYIEFFEPFDFGRQTDIWGLSTSPWSALQ